MSFPIIKVKNLSKQYRLGERESYKTFREAIVNLAKTPFRRWHRPSPQSKIGSTESFVASNPESETIWALKDVSFEVKQSEVVGIIGRNGAGKSTLLKVLSKITEPTEGRIELKGRVGSLLEVGTGFHPELTGQENIYLYGAILGMDRWEVTRKFDEILAFAELEQFMDTPVKRYSSGMYMRLAFAVAAHLEPEILLVDEVLAVGDVAFQKKCLCKMDDASKEGRTVLFVSHNMGAIQQLTEKCMLLQNGRIILEGPTIDVVDHYLNSSSDYSPVRYNLENAPRRNKNLQRQIEFIGLEFENSTTNIFPTDAAIDIQINVRGNVGVDKFRFSMTIYRIDGTPIGSFFGPEKHSLKKGEAATFRLELTDLRLAQGMYYCGIAVGKGNDRMGYTDFDIIHDVLHFEIMAIEGIDGTRANWNHGWGGIRFPEPTVEKLE